MKLGKGLQWVERGDREREDQVDTASRSLRTSAPGHMLSPEDTGAYKHQDTISATCSYYKQDFINVSAMAEH